MAEEVVRVAVGEEGPHHRLDWSPQDCQLETWPELVEEAASTPH